MNLEGFGTANEIHDSLNYQRPLSVCESVTLFLREAILRGKMEPGHQINEREITERLNTSRSPLREALRTLEKEGLVTLNPHKGASVAEVSLDELRDLLEVREMIELFAVDLIDRHAIQEFNELEQTVNIDVDPLSTLDVGQYLNEVTQFHVVLVKTAQNVKLCQLYQVLSNSIIRYQHIAATIPECMRESVQEHSDIVKAFRRGDFEEAKGLLRRHIAALKSRICNQSVLSGLATTENRR